MTFSVGYFISELVNAIVLPEIKSTAGITRGVVKSEISFPDVYEHKNLLSLFPFNKPVKC